MLRPRSTPLSSLFIPRTLTAVVAVLLTTALVAAQAKLTPEQTAALALDRKILEGAKHDSEVMKNLTYLSDEIGARLTGSAALRRANDWTADKMRRYGLENVH